MTTNEIIASTPYIVIELVNNSIGSINDPKPIIFHVNIKSESRFTIKVQNFDFTYEDLLEYLKDNELEITETYFTSTNMAQLFELVQIKSSKETVNLMPYISEYKNNCIMKLEQKRNYILSKDSYFMIGNLAANSSLKIYLKVQVYVKG